mmetsp:Transcript_19157/g.53367  ORF Transcript_19157/g.53367 Transcript_19157/m.53367 type:complete len:95 (+) Transcript_19157:320-604(+)
MALGCGLADPASTKDTLHGMARHGMARHGTTVHNHVELHALHENVPGPYDLPVDNVELLPHSIVVEGVHNRLGNQAGGGGGGRAAPQRPSPEAL